MGTALKVYNSLTRKKEEFKPLKPPFVGMYVCGPTVYGDPHLGHARPAIVFDVLKRYLTFLDYKVRYVSNITDVGHLEDEIEEQGEDKILKKARLEQIEPMEVVQQYTNSYHDAMRALNVIPPSIEPLASGHIIEQIGMIKQILEAGFAYEVSGNIYFDVVKYNKEHNYGVLSGRILEDLLAGERELEGQEEKRNRVDFALWKKAAPEHLMHWESPWGVGFPGWHLECSVMGGKYLGIPFDIHGGGMDLKFPHHECEISQSVAAFGKDPVKYWMHNNMITIDGQKMSKSSGNFITIEELFTGTHDALKQAYSPMTLRFFILQTHYRSTLDFSNDALKAAEKGLKRLMTANGLVAEMQHPGKKKLNEKMDTEIKRLCEECFDFLNDDLNTSQALANLFELSSKINSMHRDQIAMEGISKTTFELMQGTMKTLVEDVLGLLNEESDGVSDITAGLVELLISIRQEAKNNGDYATSDQIRDELQKLNVDLKDEKDGAAWKIRS